MLFIPPPLLTDSYKTTHAAIYPEAQKMVAYGEFRRSFEKDPKDSRIVLYGIRYVIENHIAVQWTENHVKDAELFFSTHYAALNPNDPEARKFPFPKDLFLEFIKEYNGYFPVKIESLPEGSVIYPHTPAYQITAVGKYSRLVTYLETLLTMLWYPSTVATLSRRCKDIIEEAYKETVDHDAFVTLDSRLHDFGFRGCTSVEQSVIGGCAHLLNFEGTDTMSAAYYAQIHLNEGRPVATSIPATEHSVMTAYPTEKGAMLKLIELYGNGLCACVMDSYDYMNALTNILPSIAKQKTQRGGVLVLRPDSGDPVEVVIQALEAAEKVFGAQVNKKGYRVINGCTVIQGDGISHVTIGQILVAAKAKGFAAQNCAFGMGGGLLQKVNRDTMSFATKLSHITYKDGTKRDVMKMPKTDSTKFSLPGELMVVRNESEGTHLVYPKDSKHYLDSDKGENAMKVVYDHGPVLEQWPSFDEVRARLRHEWSLAPKNVDVISDELKSKIKMSIQKQEIANTKDSERV
ncbi:hypothetical protein HDU76_008502 [Blyttiomyces sp. JEL0837]|nr:hypothetical protein HDU76_008502 [Blyttiomyces sp. JEL0837]